MFSRIRSFSLGFALILLSILSATGLAQQPQNPDPNQSPGVNRQRLPGRGEGRGFRRRPGRGGDFGPRLLRELNLTDEQKQQVRAVMQQGLQGTKAQRDEFRQLAQKRSQGPLTTEEQARAKALREQMRASMKDRKTKLDAVLTAEQRARLEELRKERRANHERKAFQERFGGPRGRRPGQPLGGDPILANPAKKP